MWILKTPTEYYLNGKLPTPVVVDECNRTLRLLPCNPDKQALYPDFGGYLIYPAYGSQRQQYALRQTAQGLSLRERPLGVPDLERAVHILLERARQAGHIFPGDRLTAHY